MRSLLSVSLLLVAALSFAGNGPDVPFTENKGQWPEQVLYRANIPGGVLFVERGALTYVLKKGGPLEHHAHDPAEKEEPLKMHAYRVTLEGAQGGTPQGEYKQVYYENYFLGNDPAKWGTGCAVYGLVWVKGIYPGIDLRIDGRTGLKYDLIVQPGTDAGVVRMRYDGTDGLELKDRRLRVTTSVGEIWEEAPFAYQR